jgi:hypothetical protein
LKGVKITKDITKKVMLSLKKMGKRQVLVGVPQEADGRAGEPIGNAALAAIHEGGSPVRNIPARPFLIPGAEEASKDSIRILKNGARKALEGESFDKTLNIVGINAQSKVKLRIVNQVGFAPLKKGTIAARKRDGHKGEKALIRTGELLNSIKYVVREKA